MMDKEFAEIKSALWQKIFASVVTLPFFGIGLLGWAALFVPSLRAGVPLLEPPILGSLLLALGFGFWWPIMRYSIRADKQGIYQTNGFFHQSVQWSDVAAYYVQVNDRYHKERRFHVEPILLDAQGKIIFRGFAHILVSTRKIIERRRELWDFVAEQLEGKQSEPPSPESNPETLAIRSLEVDWKKKTWRWKIARAVLLLLYAAFWLAIGQYPAYYVVTRSTGIAQPLIYLLLIWATFSMSLGPLLPYIIRMHFKKRKIAREMKRQSPTS